MSEQPTRSESPREDKSGQRPWRIKKPSQRSGSWTIISDEAIRRGRSIYWMCRCVCGFVKEVSGYNLRHGKTLGCGCEAAIKAGNANRRHGMAGTRTYIVWVGMKERCYNTNHEHYHLYGGRGISVADAWKHSFETFLVDMGVRPDGCEIDRIDTDGDYCPGNCRWVTHRQNCHNKRDNAFLEFRGERRKVIEWAELFGLTSSMVRQRIRRGWSIEKALTTPAGPA